MPASDTAPVTDESLAIVDRIFTLLAKQVNNLNPKTQKNKALKYHEAAEQCLQQIRLLLDDDQYTAFNQGNAALLQDIMQVQTLMSTPAGRLRYWKAARDIKRELKAHIAHMKLASLARQAKILEGRHMATDQTG